MNMDCLCAGKFKLGDTVRFVDYSQQDYVKGQIYNVEGVLHFKNGSGCLLSGLDTFPYHTGCFHTRFEKVNKKRGRPKKVVVTDSFEV